MLKKGLGKGLGALIPVVEPEGPTEQLFTDIERIDPSPFQPRRSFADDKIEELANSIAQKGILQPLLVRRRGDRYELVAGERRLRAARKSGLRQVPIIIKEVSDREALELALIENLQREDLGPLEEAQAYRRLSEEFGLTQEEIAQRVGKSRPAVANSLRLLSLPREVQQLLAEGQIAAGQARALLSLEREAMIVAAARQVVSRGLSARETELLVRRLQSPRRKRRDESALEPNLVALKDNLQKKLGTKVRLTHRARSGRGKIEIEYYSLSDLERIAQALL